MPIQKLSVLSQRVSESDPNDSRLQRALLDELVDITSLVSRDAHPRATEYLCGASILMTFMQHQGPMGGTQVLELIGTVLDAAREQLDASDEAIKSPSVYEGLARKTDGLNALNDVLLGRVLSQKGLIAEEQIKSALELQHQSGLRFGEALLKLGAVTWTQLEEGLRFQDSSRQMAADAEPDSIKPSKAEPMTLTIESEARPGLSLKLMSDVLLGEVMLRNELITQDQLTRGLAHQRGSGMRIGEALVDLGACDWSAVDRAIELQGQMKRYAS